MAIVIGAATTVDFDNKCVISASWDYNANTQRLYCIGEWEPSDNRTYHKPTETLNLTIYSPGPRHDIPATRSCTDANTIYAAVNPAACGNETYSSMSGQWWVTSYSYNKDDGTLPGQESWSLTRWKNLSTPASAIGTTSYPTYIMRGITEGQGTSNSGLRFLAEGRVYSQNGSVSAGGFGRADTLLNGVVDSVGAGSNVAGETGQGSASISYTQLYI